MFESIVGQDRIKQSLEINIRASQIENKPLPHILFSGFAGGGKTQLAKEIGIEMEVYVQESNGAVLSNIKALLPFLSRITSKSIFFIDEIHSCSPKVFDYLLTASLEFKMQIGDIICQIPTFTLIGATTNPGLVIKPLRDRFVLQYSLEPYKDSEIAQIIDNNHPDISDAAINLLVRTSRGIPRIALNRLRFVNNYAISQHKSDISLSDVEHCLNLEGVNNNGLTKDDFFYIKTLTSCQPAGISTLAASTGFSQDYIENVIEPYLLSKNIIIKTGKGRKLVNEKIK